MIKMALEVNALLVFISLLQLAGSSDSSTQS